MRVCHISILHFRYDLRIFVRQCQSLANKGFDVHYIVADGRGSEIKDGIHIHDLGQRPGIFRRITFLHTKLLRRALDLDASVYHFHDPELIPIGLILKKKGKCVIADVHEDTPKQLLGNIKRSFIRRNLTALAASKLERYAYPKFDAIVTASPNVQNRIAPFTRKVVNISCFPDVEKEFAMSPGSRDKKYDIVYLGSISPIRGIYETLKAIEGSNISYVLAGDFQGLGFESQLKQEKAWKKNTTYAGFLEDRKQLTDILYASRIGMANTLPNLNFAGTYLVKMFEYMAAGIPVIATNFEFWRAIIEKNNCGICIDPTDVRATREVIQLLLNEVEYAIELGRNGRRAVEEHFNWKNEELKLLKLYNSIL